MARAPPPRCNGGTCCNSGARWRPVMSLPLVDRELHAALNEAPAPASEAGARPAAAPRHFDIDCRLDYQLSGPCDFLFQVHALDGIDQSVLRESLQLSPKLAHHMYPDPTVGHRFLRVHAEAGPLTLRYRARVERRPQPAEPHAPEVPIAALPDDVLHNLMPTRYCESDLLGSAAFKLFAGMPPGHARVQAITDWIHDNIEYRIGSSQPTTTARDVFVQRAGVCRDFAHLGITFCRALNIPARLVVGYAIFDEPPPDFHAVFEAFIGGRWVMFDPTRLSPVDDLVRIAVGRDAKDVAFATIFGPATMTAMSPEIRRVRPRAQARR
jgi:transglutaminase-like putative cysteine protease